MDWKERKTSRAKVRVNTVKVEGMERMENVEKKRGTIQRKKRVEEEEGGVKERREIKNKEK